MHLAENQLKLLKRVQPSKFRVGSRTYNGVRGTFYSQTLITICRIRIFYQRQCF